MRVVCRLSAGVSVGRRCASIDLPVPGEPVVSVMGTKKPAAYFAAVFTGFFTSKAGIKLQSVLTVKDERFGWRGSGDPGFASFFLQRNRPPLPFRCIWLRVAPEEQTDGDPFFRKCTKPAWRRGRLPESGSVATRCAPSGPRTSRF